MRSILPAAPVARLDLERLTVCSERDVDKTLRDFEMDLLSLVPVAEGSEEATEAFIFVRVERQSTPDPFMTLRSGYGTTSNKPVVPTFRIFTGTSTRLPVMGSMVIGPVAPGNALLFFN